MTSCSVSKKRRHSAGFTVVELLIGMAILGLLLAVLGALFLGTRRAYDANRAVTASAAQLRSAIEFLEYDVALAGYAGLRSLAEPAGLPLTVSDCLSADCNPKGLPGRLLDALTVRYVEDRYTPDGLPVPVNVSYTVRDGTLYRCDSNAEPCGSATPGTGVAEGILGLELRAFRSESGGPAQTMPPVVTGLDLRLHYLRSGKPATEDFSIALLNRMENR